MKMIDLTGKMFHYWTVIERAANDAQGRAHWMCKCICGKVSIVHGSMLRSNHTKSCGCKRAELVSKGKTIHGMSDTKIFRVWANMIRRCHSKKCDAYKFYGGRGIIVCDRWRNSFTNFLADMGDRPTPKHEIDRINNNGNYEPENCRWTTRHVQVRNRRSNKLITYKGRTQTQEDWAQEFGMPHQLLWTRMHRDGLSFEEALTKPRQRSKA